MGGKFSNDYNDRASPLNHSQNNEANELGEINGKTTLNDEDGKPTEDQQALDDQPMIDETGLTANDKNSQALNQPQSDRLNRLSPSSIGTASSYDQQIKYDKVKDKGESSLKNVNLSKNEYSGMDDEFAPLDLTKTNSQQTNNGDSEKTFELLHSLHKRINDNYQLHQQQLLQQQFDGQLAAAVARGYFGQSNSVIGASSPLNENSSSAPGLVGANEAADGLNVFLHNKRKREQDQLMQEMAAAVSGQLNQPTNESQFNNVSSLLAGLPSGFDASYARMQMPVKRRGRPENSARRAVNDMISLNGLFGKDDLAGASKLCNQILKHSPLNSGLLNRKDQPMPIIGPNDQIMFPCNQCDKTFSKQSSLARHKYEHSGNYPN